MGVPKKRALILAAAIAVLAIGGAVNAQAASPRATDSWTVQFSLRQKPAEFDGITCPTRTFCVADGQAVVEQTSNGGKDWASDALERYFTVFRVSCSSAFVCRGVGLTRGGNYQKFMTETARSMWVPSSGIEDEIEPTSIEALSCPTFSECVAVGANNLIGGNANGFPYWKSTTQTSEAGHLSGWRASLIPFRHGSIVVGLDSVDCPSASVCYALAQLRDDGVVVLKTTTGAAQWFRVSITNSQAVSRTGVMSDQFSDLSCATVASCAVVGVGPGGHLIIVETDNGGLRWHWSVEPRPPTPTPDQPYIYPAVSCASATSCTATDGARLLNTSDGGERWSSFFEPKSDGLPSALSCPAPNECFVTTELPISVKLQGEGLWSSDIVLWRR